MAGKISISITDEHAALLQEAVVSGAYASSSEVVREALREWQARRVVGALWDAGLASGRAKPAAAAAYPEPHMPHVFFTQAAREDLIEIWTHIAEDDPAAADRVLDRLDEAATCLTRNPQMGPARDDIRPGLRYLVSGSHLFLYRMFGDDIEIVRAVHGRRDLYGLF